MLLIDKKKEVFDFPIFSLFLTIKAFNKLILNTKHLNN